MATTCKIKLNTSQSSPFVSYLFMSELVPKCPNLVHVIEICFCFDKHLSDHFSYSSTIFTTSELPFALANRLDILNENTIVFVCQEYNNWNTYPQMICFKDILRSQKHDSPIRHG